MNAKEIAKILDRHRFLNIAGFGLFNHGLGLTDSERSATMREDRATLLASSAECSAVCEWLARMDRSEGPRVQRPSHELAQDMVWEREIPVSNGAFIVAALHKGYLFEIIPNSQSVTFSVPEKSFYGAMLLRR